MVERTIVSIYEVDEWATTGPWVGQGSLVNPGIVLVHPPLSDRIVGGEGPKRLRVGIFPSQHDTPTGQFVEVLDVWGEPRVLRKKAVEGAAEGAAVVALELRTPARSPVYQILELDWTKHDENDYEAIARHLRGFDWVDRDFLICKIWPWRCKH
jgi:hypothetical protein